MNFQPLDINDFRAIVESSNIACFVCEISREPEVMGKIRFANEAMAHLSGYIIVELLEMSVEDLIPERYRKNHFRHMLVATFGKKSSHSMGGNVRAIFPLLSQSGEEIPVQIYLFKIREDAWAGKIIDMRKSYSPEDEKETEESKLEDLFIEGKIDLVLESFSRSLPDEDERQDAFLLLAQYNRSVHQRSKNLLSIEDFNKQVARISNNIVKWLFDNKY